MDAFRQEITKLIPHLRRYAFALINHKESADDLVQDCLERALKRKQLWDASRPLKPWLFTILHNIFANDARRYHRTPALVSIHDIEELVDKKSENNLALSELYRSLEQLSIDHQQIILLVGVEQLSYKETAEVLNIPIGTVMSRLTRARKQLKQQMHSQSNSHIRRIK